MPWERRGGQSLASSAVKVTPGRVEKATPDEASDKVEESGIDTLAVSVGFNYGKAAG